MHARQNVLNNQTVTLDGSLEEWTAAEQIDRTLSLPGYDIYAKWVDDVVVFALRAPVAIGANTTAWLNTDQNAATGFQIFGFAGGAEFNVNFDATGTPRLYTGDAGQNRVANVTLPFATSADHTIVEFAVPLDAIGSPEAISTLWDINNQTFLPTDFSLVQYEVVTSARAPVVGSVTLDGSLEEWDGVQPIDESLSVEGYDIFAQVTDGFLVFGLTAPVAIGANTTAWLNTDRNPATGFQIFGFAGGAEFNVNFDESGTPQLYTGDAGQNLVEDVFILFGASADRTTLEFAVPLSAIGSPEMVDTLWDINNETFLPVSFALTQYTAPAPAVVGSVTLDGSLDEWTAAQQIDQTLSVPGYDIYAQTTGGSLVFAVSAPVAIGANTTAWLNTDRDPTTGFQIFGFAGGAEFNIDFDENGTPRLYTGGAGENLVEDASVSFGASADRRIVEFAVPLAAIGSPQMVDTLWDINNETFLPVSFALTQYTAPPPAVVGSITLDGSLSDWIAAEQIDHTLSLAGYDIFGKATADSLVFALSAPVAIGANTTAWLNTDQNAATGFQIFGFAGGAEFNINFDESGTPHLYTGDAGENLVEGAIVSFGASADRRVVEFAVPLSAIGSPAAVGTLWDINNETFLPTDFSLVQYQVVVVPPPPVFGSVTLDGSLSDWTAAEQIDQTLSLAGYDIYAKAADDALVFALQAPVAIGANTTAWLNTDQNAATGFQIFGFAGGAEFNINFDESGTPRLYTGDAGENLVLGVPVAFAASADRTIVEFAVPLSAIGSPEVVSTLWDINNSVFLPTDFSIAQYEIVTVARSSVVGSVTLDGSLDEWAAAEQIDEALSVAGYDIYARTTGESLVFALSAPVAIGANTTAWLNTDQDATTGFQIFGFAGGAEFNVNFDVTGTPRLYTGDAGETLVGGVIPFAYSADRTTVEFAVPLSAIGSPATVSTLWDINNDVFLPTDFSLVQYEIDTSAPEAATLSASAGASSLSLGGAESGEPLDIRDLFAGAEDGADSGVLAAFGGSVMSAAQVGVVDGAPLALAGLLSTDTLTQENMLVA